MADQKKWFKVWSSILLDPHHMNMTLENVGRWVRLGAMMVSQGENGRLLLIPPATHFVVAMNCPNFEQAMEVLKGIPNVCIDVCNEEGKSGHGEIIVTMKNWYKYQVDSTHAERKKWARYKRRGEESRKEKSKNTPFIPPTISEVQDFAKVEGLPLDAPKFFNHYQAKGWMAGRVKMKDWRAAARLAANDWATTKAMQPSWM